MKVECLSADTVMRALELPMNVRLLFKKIIERWRQEGIRGCWHATVKYFLPSAPETFDLKFKTDTNGIVPLWRLKTVSPNAVFGHRYEATDGEELERAIGYIGENLSNFMFIDLGCGKGRALIVASHLGFKKVLGVEFAPELAEIARKNLAQLGLSHALVVQGDVADFSFPNSDLIIYLFNPFSGEVLRQVIAGLQRCEAKRIYVVYNSPKCADILDSSGFFTRLGPPLATRWTIQIWRKASC